VRALAEAEAKKLRDAEIRQGFEPVIQALQESPELRTEFELLGTPQVDLPDEPEEFLRNWVQQAEQLKQQGPA
jgi:hypothetical protein